MATKYPDYIAATGVPLNGEPAPSRRNLLDMLRSNEQMYLYLEGLKRFQQEEPDNPLSWFQIAGIHGRPYTTWPPYDKEIQATGNLDDRDLRGFCTHSSILFLTWHRPYLALFEFALWTHVNKIAEGIDSSHPEKEKYVSLAKQFRIPYWDWARKDVQPVPEEVLVEKYRGPSGPPSKNRAKRFDYNPLFAYALPDHVKGLKDEELKTIKIFTDPSGKDHEFPATVRYPFSGGGPEKGPRNALEFFYRNPYDGSGKSRNLVPPPGQAERNLTERTSLILRTYQTYAAVSNNSFRWAADDPNRKRRPIVEDAENWGSLEDIHNAVHNLSGGGGNMSAIPKSAFDPIFWLHHTNIDRLFVIWQGLHETSDDKSFVTPRVNVAGNYVVKKNVGEENINSGLYPFKLQAKSGSWYTSKDTKRTEDLGYTYPETAGMSWPPTEAERQKLEEVVQEVYPILPREIRKSKNDQKDAGIQFLPQAAIAKRIADTKVHVPATAEKLDLIVEELPKPEVLLKESNEAGKPLLRDLAPKGTYLEWMVNLKALKHALGGAFSVHIFLGPANDEPNVYFWPKVPTHVGTFAPLGQTSDTGCEKCQLDQAGGLEITGQIPLTIALVERYLAGLLPSLEKDDVVPYLQANLHWRIADGAGTVIQNRETAQATGLTVLVVSNEVDLSDSSRPPIYSPKVTIHPEVTTNQNNQSRGFGTGLTAPYAFGTSTQ